MNWFKRLIRRVTGGADRYHEQAQQITVNSLRSELRERRVQRLTAELELYRRRNPNAR